MRRRLRPYRCLTKNFSTFSLSEIYSYAFYLYNISKYDKETDKGEQKHIIDLPQQLPVNKQENNHGDGGGHRVGNDPKHRQQAQKEQRKVNHQLLTAADAGLLHGSLRQGAWHQREGRGKKCDQADGGKRKCYREEVADAQVIERV